MRILVVEDDPHIGSGLKRDLSREGFSVDLAKDGRMGEFMGATDTYDMVVLDLGLPIIPGLDVLKSWRAAGNPVPVLILTAQDGWHERVDGFQAGADDYLAKPFHTEELVARIRAITNRSIGTVPQATVNALREQNHRLQIEVDKRRERIELLQNYNIDALTELAKMRDNDTGEHIRRTQEYVRTLATWLGAKSRYADTLNEISIELIAQSAPLHDIGKVGIPDSILLKAGKLTPDEWEVMKTHAAMGAQALELLEQRHSEAIPHMVYAKQIARSHHEKWDGSGYPDGLVGETIPLAARLMALADVFDALISKRVYKASWSFDDAREFIVGSSGSHFDPLLVNAFEATFEDCLVIAEQYAD